MVRITISQHIFLCMLLFMYGCTNTINNSDTSRTRSQQYVTVRNAGLTDLEFINTMPDLLWLDVENNNAIDDITPVCNTPMLQHLNCARCGMITDVEPLRNLTHLEYLDLSHCSISNGLAPIGACTSLQYLNLREYQDTTPTNLSFLTSLRKLEFLDLRDGINVTDPSPIMNCTACTDLRISGEAFHDLAFAAGFTKLKNLTVSKCTNISDLSPIITHHSIESIHLSECPSLETIAFSEHTPHLRNLEISGCARLSLVLCRGLPVLSSLSIENNDIVGIACTDLPELQDFTFSNRPASWKFEIRDSITGKRTPSYAITACFQNNQLLKKIDLSAHENIRITALSGLPSLEYLKIPYTSNVQSLSDFGPLPCLRYLDISHCSSLHDVSALQGYPQLGDLYLNHCPQIRKIILGGNTNLKIFSSEGCRSVKEIALMGLPLLKDLSLAKDSLGQLVLHDLRNIESLLLQGSRRLEFASIKDLPALTMLSFDTCMALDEIEISGVPSLSTVSMRYSTVSDISFLAPCTLLTHIYLDLCPAVSDISVLADKPSLQYVSVLGPLYSRDLSPLLSSLGSGDTLAVQGYTSTIEQLKNRGVIIWKRW